MLQDRPGELVRLRGGDEETEAGGTEPVERIGDAVVDDGVEHGAVAVVLAIEGNRLLREVVAPEQPKPKTRALATAAPVLALAQPAARVRLPYALTVRARVSSEYPGSSSPADGQSTFEVTLDGASIGTATAVRDHLARELGADALLLVLEIHVDIRAARPERVDFLRPGFDVGGLVPLVPQTEISELCRHLERRLQLLAIGHAQRTVTAAETLEDVRLEP